LRHRYRTGHQWIAFLDCDEFLVIADPNIADLPQLLQSYEEYGGLAVNWQVTCWPLASCSLLQSHMPQD
jgi:hypothetical protein